MGMPGLFTFSLGDSCCKGHVQPRKSQPQKPQQYYYCILVHAKSISVTRRGVLHRIYKHWLSPLFLFSKDLTFPSMWLYKRLPVLILPYHNQTNVSAYMKQQGSGFHTKSAAPRWLVRADKWVWVCVLCSQCLVMMVFCQLLKSGL